MYNYKGGLISKYVIICEVDGISKWFKDYDNNKRVVKWGDFMEAKGMPYEVADYYKRSLLEMKFKGVKRFKVGIVLEDKVNLIKKYGDTTGNKVNGRLIEIVDKISDLIENIDKNLSLIKIKED